MTKEQQITTQEEPRTIKPRSRPFISTLLRFGLFLLVGIIIGAVLVGWFMMQSPFANQRITERQRIENDGNLQTTSEEDVIAKVADHVSPSVVSIKTNVPTTTRFGRPALGEAAGTGIVVSSDGYILTNKHVVDGAEKVEIVATDGTSYDDVTIVGADPLNDVAYLKINGVTELSAATLGDSSTIRVGQGVIAIGNSLGQYQNTVTSGIISGKGRPVTAGNQSGDMENLTDLLQTDAAINPGNSGGPLLNRAGQVIGINTAVAANAEGMGFAIPINATKGTLKSVLSGKGVRRAYLGVRYTEVTPDTAKENNLAVTYGAYVAGGDTGEVVGDDSPAGKAGIRTGDVIVKIGGLTVGEQGGVSSLIGEYAPGDTVELVINRSGREQTVKVTLGSYNT